jgi:hypothetical protein
VTTREAPRRRYVDDVRAGLPVAVAAGCVFVGWLVVGAFLGSDAVIRYAASVPFLICAVVVANHHIGFSRGVLWGFVVWESVHMAGGLIPVGHDHILYNAGWGVPLVRWDRLVHAFGFGLATAASWQAIRRILPAEHGVTPGIALLAALCGLGFGALIEVLEFLMTLVVPTNVGDYVDTGWDLVADLIGAGVVAVWLALHPGPPRSFGVPPSPQDGIPPGVRSRRRPRAGL